MALFGVVNNLVGLAKNYGKLTEIYNGAVSASAPGCRAAGNSPAA
jgi:hypothetical protein